MANNKDVKEHLIEEYGDECMVEQIDENYTSQILRQSLPGYKPKDDELIAYKDKYLVKGYNIRHIKQQTPERQAEIEKAMDMYKTLMVAKIENRKYRSKNMRV